MAAYSLLPRTLAEFPAAAAAAPGGRRHTLRRRLGGTQQSSSTLPGGMRSVSHTLLRTSGAAVAVRASTRWWGDHCLSSLPTLK